MTLLPDLTDDERRELTEQRARDAEAERALQAALAAACAAQEHALDTLAHLATELGFPLTRSLRPPEEDVCHDRP